MTCPYKKQVEKAINCLANELLDQQQSDGRWSFCFESGTMTDAYMLLLMNLLDQKDPILHEALVERIIHKQTSSGTWKLFYDEKEGNLSSTIDTSIALLYSGAKSANDPEMKKTIEFLQSHGGIKRAGSMTRIVQTLLRHGSWSQFPKLPIEFLLLPLWGPVNFFDFVGYTRVHAAPILIVADSSYFVQLSGYEEVDKWLSSLDLSSYSEQPQPPIYTQEEILQTLSLPYQFRSYYHQQAVQIGQQFMLNRIEKDGTLYSYMTSTFLMIFALLSLGFPKNHPVIQKAYHGLTQLVYPLPQGAHLQETTSTVWDTSLILYALQKAGVSSKHPSIKKGLAYLKKRQHTKIGDWKLRNPLGAPGGWGFSDINTINPDVDDTTACLRAFTPTVRKGKKVNTFQRGLQWLRSMQNSDGGWPAFERNTNKFWFKFLPFEDGKSVWGDPSSADLTGRTLQFIGSELDGSLKDIQVQRAYQWLIKNQLPDGSWFGRWGVTYIYGTWAALTGLASIGIPKEHPTVAKGTNWLHSIQNEDGGWGESCYSDTANKYIPLNASTPVQTAWALDALIAFHDQPTPEIESGIQCLLFLLEQRGWEWTYPVGAGLADQFYIYYHSYPYIWPLVTLSNYLQKYNTKKKKS
ncbi:prenyltransferase/squalene oxidase repeat-containing protein [Hazenella coriacea]|uniref:Sporulenol synthase n=1 Tax=Hazenella coriacea TaxID=1179467 RepID=A0A4R3L3G8_9BACL|nr:prenyltransferase/squalene oxidase repeat-containing protein [Hazenella coriacea]TCS92203.1 sporulenol synthase [Hazenella coriacea]